jgi:hypothetical protein
MLICWNTAAKHKQSEHPRINRLPVVPLLVYTTAAMEKLLNAEYKEKVKQMATQMDPNSKYTPVVHVGYRATPFEVDGGVVTIRGAPCPSEKQPGGKMYTLVPKFSTQVAEFHKRHNCYQVRIAKCVRASAGNIVSNNTF